MSDWTNHDGEGLPVDPKAIVSVRIRGGSEYSYFRAEEYCDADGSWWEHNQTSRDIISYQLGTPST